MFSHFILASIMKFSIVIPCFNEEEYLPRLLNSINNLDWPRSDFEVIVVDNNSIDSTTEVALQMKADKVVKEPNQGVVWARQRGFLESRGEVFCGVDADCEVPKNWLKIIDSVLSQKEIVAVSGICDFPEFGRFDRIFGKFIQKFIYPIVPKILKFIFRKPAALIVGANFAAKKRVLEELKGFNTKIKFWGEDADMAMRLVKIGKVVFFPQLEVKTSARRFKKEGKVNTTLKYFLNYFWIYFFNKPFIEEK